MELGRRWGTCILCAWLSGSEGMHVWHCCTAVLVDTQKPPGTCYHVCAQATQHFIHRACMLKPPARLYWIHSAWISFLLSTTACLYWI
jgi:hypothetical protein